jgi:nucleoside-diphosphate-sugar epimerase
MNRLLVTGGTGFLGEPCARAASGMGFEVRAVGSRDCDLLQPGAAARLIETVRPTHLLHLAWIATPGVFWESADNWRWLRASQELLLAFARAGGVRAVTAGTCAEYDWTAGGTLHERNTPTRPATTYGRAKLALGAWANALGRARGISAAHARLFWMYGPREHPARLVPSVANALLRGEPALCSEGTQARDFLHAHDIADALVRLVGSDVRGPVNVASGAPVPVREVVQHVAAATGRADLVRFGARPTSPNEPPVLVADVARLRNELNWTPRVPLAGGLGETVNWWREHRAA